MNKTSTDFSNARQVRRVALELECTGKFVPNFSHGQYNCLHINKHNTGSCNLNKRTERVLLSSEIGSINTVALHRERSMTEPR